jgi:DNA-binding MarR family transcriptional regulator
VARLDQLSKQRIRLDLPAAQARLLAAIEASGEACIGDLAAVDNCSQPTMTNQVRLLVKAGMVTRTSDARDGRIVRIRITPLGTRTLQSIRADRVAAIEPRLATLSSAERQVLTDAIGILSGLIDKPYKLR